MMSDPTYWPFVFIATAAICVIVYAYLGVKQGGPPEYYIAPRRTWHEDAEERLREMVQEQGREIADLRRENRELRRKADD